MTTIYTSKEELKSREYPLLRNVGVTVSCAFKRNSTIVVADVDREQPIINTRSSGGAIEVGQITKSVTEGTQYTIDQMDVLIAELQQHRERLSKELVRLQNGEIDVDSMVLKELTIREARKLWAFFGDIPVDQNDTIEVVWEGFPIGTHRETIWHWFESHFNVCVAEDLMSTNEALRKAS